MDDLFNDNCRDLVLKCSKYTNSIRNDLIHFLVKNSRKKKYFNDLKKYILNNPHKVNIQNEKGFTPLMIASQYSNTTSSVETIVLLLKHNADPNLQTKQPKKDFSHNYIRVIKNYEDFYEEGWTVLMFASRYSNTTSNNETVELLLQNNADPNIQNYGGETALMMASRFSNTESSIKTVEYLLKYSADPNIKNNDLYDCYKGYCGYDYCIGDSIDDEDEFNCWTALMYACLFSNTTSNNETVELLLQNNADPNIKSDEGCTALMVASYNSNVLSNNEVVELLLEHGADPNIKDDEGLTALMSLSSDSDMISNIETIELLLKYGADPNIKNKDGKNICDKFFEENPSLLEKYKKK